MSPESEHKVKKDMVKKSILLLIIVVLVISAKVSLSGNDDEAYIIGLRYPKGYDAKTYQDLPDTRTVRYKVNLPFPSKDVVDFYDAKLKDIGWFPFVQPNYPETDKIWQQLIDGTVAGNPLVHRLNTIWVNKDKSKMVLLIIRYFSVFPNKQERMYVKEPRPNNNIQVITLQIMPFKILPPS